VSVSGKESTVLNLPYYFQVLNTLLYLISSTTSEEDCGAESFGSITYFDGVI
jgi:hypothetical protein